MDGTIVRSKRLGAMCVASIRSIVFDDGAHGHCEMSRKQVFVNVLKELSRTRERHELHYSSSSAL